MKTNTHTPIYSICTETGLRVCEIRKNLLVREDGLVKNINIKARTRKDYWNNGFKATREYRQIRVNKKLEYIHRLISEAFLPNTNNHPQINHINHNEMDNRVENLEWCDNRYNCSNQKQHLNKLVGASYKKERAHLPNPWQSRIRIKGRLKYLGYFTTEQLAHEAYLEFLADTQNEEAPV